MTKDRIYELRLHFIDSMTSCVPGDARFKDCTFQVTVVCNGLAINGTDKDLTLVSYEILRGGVFV